MNCAYLAFTAKGLALAQQLAQTCPGSVSRCGLGGVTLAGWTAQQFAAADALVFVGAAQMTWPAGWLPPVVRCR